MVKNESETFWFIYKRVEPRCCAPDRCSGRTPASINDPSAPDYDRIESAITSILLQCFLIDLLDTGVYPQGLCKQVLRSTITLDCGTPNEQFDLLPLFEKVSHDYLTSEDSQRDSPYECIMIAFRMLYDKIVSRFLDPNSSVPLSN